MRKTTMALIAIAAVVAMAMPAALSVTAPAPSMKATTLEERGGLELKLLAPLVKRTEWYGGAVIPVRILLTDKDLGISVAGANATIWVNDVAGTSVGSQVSMGNNFTDLGGGMYMFNLNTKPYPAGPGSPQITIKIVAHAPDDRGAELVKMLSLN